jgi:hypothetical protein
MAQATHQILGRRASCRRESLASMPQVMEPETRHPRPAPSTIEGLPDGIAAHRGAIASDEYPILTRPGRHVLSQDRQHMRRDDDRALASISLGIGVERNRRLQQLNAVTAHRDRSCPKINVRAAQAQDFAPAQATPRSKEHRSPVSRSDRLHQGNDLTRRCDRPLRLVSSLSRDGLARWRCAVTVG